MGRYQYSPAWGRLGKNDRLFETPLGRRAKVMIGVEGNDEVVPAVRHPARASNVFSLEVGTIARLLEDLWGCDESFLLPVGQAYV
jgi:hypothetical protein